MSIQQFASQLSAPQDPALAACLELRRCSMADLTRCNFIAWDPWEPNPEREPPPA